MPSGTKEVITMSSVLTKLDVEDAVRRVLDTHRSPWHSTESAAAYIGCEAGTLKTWRTRGEGPRYHLINGKSVRYHRDDLDSFIRGEDAR
jgi:hypothetical protein